MTRGTRLLVETGPELLDLSVLLLRCTIGIVLFVAGAGKVFGWFGGPGMEAAIGMFAAKLGIPAPLTYLSSYTELIGGILLVLGLLARPAAFAVAINMLVATVVSLPGGFLKAAAFPFSMMMIAVAVLLSGPMGYSLDFLILQQDKNRRE
jgi:putative oxidoreductase